MKGGRDEEKVMGPLFPRLHVNDTEKGGPRAPPRNKMALYEQLSIPSQRFSSGGQGSPLPPRSSTSIVPSASSNQGIGHERSVFPPFYIPSALISQSTEKMPSQLPESMDANMRVADLCRKSAISGYKSSNLRPQFSSTAECSSTPLQHFSNPNTFYGKKSGDDDFRVPTFAHSGGALLPQEEHGQALLCKINPGRSTVTAANAPWRSAGATSSSSHVQDVNSKTEVDINTRETKAGQQGRNKIENELKQITAEKCSVERSSSPTSYGEKAAESLRCAKDNNRGGVGISCRRENAENTNVSGVGNELGSRTSFANGHTSLNVGETCSVDSEDRHSGSVRIRDGETNDDSETSMVDSVLGLEISPDDVVGAIGQKRFWRARKAIVHQQRVFAIQVFELHRLIKVQRLIAGKPDILLDDHLFLRSPKVSPKKVVASEPRAVEQKDESHSLSQTSDCPSGNPTGKLPLPSVENGVNRGLANQTPSYGPCMANTQQPSNGPDNKANPWCFSPWLVPVVSPSEGLIFKPYTGPCPPPGAFMPPVYGGCGPMNLPIMAGDYMAHAYGVPASLQQRIGVHPGTPGYFPPYGFPVMNPTMSASAIEQVNMMGGLRPSPGKAEKLSTAVGNFNTKSRVSCNTLNGKRDGISYGHGRFQSSKESEVHGSTASSPCENVQGGHVSEGRDPLPLFPMGPTGESSDQNPQVQASNSQTRVIKVVPHNAKSASESAARIFQSIQEERQQHESH